MSITTIHPSPAKGTLESTPSKSEPGAESALRKAVEVLKDSGVTIDSSGPANSGDTVDRVPPTKKMEIERVRREQERRL